MKQLLATGLIALFCALVVSAGWPESATELGHTASNAQVAVAALFMTPLRFGEAAPIKTERI